MPGIVPLCCNRAFEPRNGFIVAFEFDHVRADVIVRIAKFRIHLDRSLAFGNGLINFSLKVECPSQERMRLSRGIQCERSSVERDSAVVIALHLCLVRFCKLLLRLRFAFIRHAAFWAHRQRRVKPYRVHPSWLAGANLHAEYSERSAEWSNRMEYHGQVRA